METRAADIGGVHHSEAQGVAPRPATAAVDLIKQFHDAATEVSDLIKRFYDAPIQADFDQKETAPVVGYSESWLERARVYGGGPAFVRLGGTFKINKNGERRIYGGRVRYPKTAILEFLAKRRLVTSTSQYIEPQEAAT
jgi:hypothetical protein